MRRFIVPALTTALLTACTGTEEVQYAVQLGVLTDTAVGVATQLRALNTDGGSVNTTPVTGGVDVLPLSGARRLITVRTGGAETRAPNGTDPQPFADPGFTPCYTRAAQDATRTRLLLLSECSGVQRAALFNADTRALLWTALLPTYLPPVATSDTPPTRLAVQGDVGLITRARLNGGSEVIRVAIPSGAATPEVSAPLAIPSVFDLAPYAGRILAATATGIQALKSSGEPDSATTLTAFGTNRFDRLWVGGANDTLLAAWRSNVLAGTADSPLRLWDGNASSAATVANLADIRDLTLPSDGKAYVLAGQNLNRYDVTLGLTTGNWAPKTLTTLTAPLSIAWTVPVPTP
ncbi:hypothetical protein [Deinococcus radiotolerans]|uniref:Lipoprotein n=1 Tax=Deinococcus radiotolerans TaxID=1309407 RepID=A0ABQ2FPX4_9DEIO|nr:hypothetical protein [Deinococcus radiotolerans]GGL15163.1 hypothetical protein GCM10010844_37440 [Deinococcus radiotolerans]